MDKDIDKALEGEEKDLPESSANLNIRGYLKGFSIQITKRGMVAQPLLQQSIKIVEWMEMNGFNPSWNDATNAKKYENTETGMPFPDDSAVSSPPCSFCGEATTTKSGVTKGRKWTGVFCSTEQKAHTVWR